VKAKRKCEGVVRNGVMARSDSVGLLGSESATTTQMEIAGWKSERVRLEAAKCR